MLTWHYSKQRAGKQSDVHARSPILVLDTEIAGFASFCQFLAALEYAITARSRSMEPSGSRHGPVARFRTWRSVFFRPPPGSAIGPSDPRPTPLDSSPCALRVIMFARFRTSTSSVTVRDGWHERKQWKILVVTVHRSSQPGRVPPTPRRR